MNVYIDKEKIQNFIMRIPPYAIGSDGQLLAWNKEFEEALPDHRHTSHLLSLYPLKTCPDEEKWRHAVKRTLERRFHAGGPDIYRTNWSLTSLIVQYGHLYESEKAWELVRQAVSAGRANCMIPHISNNIDELDGNTGFTAGMANRCISSRIDESDLTVTTGF